MGQKMDDIRIRNRPSSHVLARYEPRRRDCLPNRRQYGIDVCAARLTAAVDPGESRPYRVRRVCGPSVRPGAYRADGSDSHCADEVVAEIVPDTPPILRPNPKRARFREFFSSESKASANSLSALRRNPRLWAPVTLADKETSDLQIVTD
jgi:hypothetical protein